MSTEIQQPTTLLASQQPAEQVHLDTTAIDKIGKLSTLASAIRQQGDAFFALVPKDHTLENVTAAIEATALAPRRKAGTQRLSDISSFAAYVTQQGDPACTYIYADHDSRTLVAVLNDHALGSDGAVVNQPGRRDHRAVYQAEYSREFTTWLNNSGVKMDQEAFAIFLEDNIADIAPPAEGSDEPSGDALYAVALTLQAKTEVDFKSHQRLDNGQVQLTYSEQTSATAGADGTLSIPREFFLGVRLFKNAQAYKIRARLKYRLGAGKVKFWYELDRPLNAVEEAFQAYVDAAVASGYTVLMGQP
ncbi:DUF2303 family protein [Duganella sp.]|uniref:DUF2303 family protein n=1 Tax=Duganella sp. TaxID=1904440 RepID=UPI0031E1DD72